MTDSTDKDGRLPEPLAESADELFDHAPCGYMSTLPDGTIVRVNETFLAWTSFTRAELVGARRFQDLLTIGGKIFYETHLGPLLAMQGHVSAIAVDIVRRDGRTMPSLVNVLRKLDPDGQPAIYRTTIIDATDRRNYERELLVERRNAEEATKAKADLLAMLSHDVRTPLGSILLLSELLTASGLTGPQKAHVQRLRNSANSLLELVDEVLEMSRIESGMLRLEPRPFELRALLRDLVEIFGVRAEQKGVSLRVAVDENTADRLVGDAGKLRQVLSNLLGNAVKFTQHGSVVLSVHTKVTSGDAVTLGFAVTDTGIGIPEDELANIFLEFRQVGDDMKNRYGGAGLGLAISRKLAELLGSKIHVESAPGVGSTFTLDVSLKLEQDPPGVPLPQQG